MKLLQCSLGQQSVVRLTLYQNFPEVVSRNPELLPECVKMLRNHLKFYADPGSGIRLEMCVTKDANSAHVTEPLGHLIQAIPQVKYLENKSVTCNCMIFTLFFKISCRLFCAVE